MKHSFHNVKFRRKILAVYAVVYLIASIVSGVLYYNYSADDTIKNFRISSEDIMRQLNDTLSTRLNMIDKHATAVLSNRAFVYPLSSYLSKHSDVTLTTAMGTMADFLKDICLGENLIHSTYIHTTRRDFEDFTRIRNRSFVYADSVFATIYADSSARAKQWLPAMKDEIFIGDESVIPYVIRFPVQDATGLSYLIIQISQKELAALLKHSYDAVDQLFIVDEQGRDIVHSEGMRMRDFEDFFAEAAKSSELVYSGDMTYDGQSYLTSVTALGINHWQIVILKSKESLMAKLKTLRRNIFLLTGLLLLVSSIVIVVLSRRMTQALSRLERQMNCVRGGDLSTRFYYPYRDEVGSLGKSFNYMTDEIETLVESQKQNIADLKLERDRVAEVQKQKRKAELRALQAQINPHFLYNTLNTITWQAADQGAKEISILSNSLGKFFRLSLSRGAEVIPLADEIEHVANYLSIQSIRYQDKLQYVIDLPEELRDWHVIKLILQPLVENSIYHGIKVKDGPGHIEIRVQIVHGRPAPADTTETLVQLTVEDDGVGIAAAQLADINTGLRMGITDRAEGYGIYNVNERIQLYYGKQYGLQYESSQNTGTKAVIFLPFHGQGVE